MKRYIEYIGEIKDYGVHDGGLYLYEDDVGSMNLDKVFEHLYEKRVKIVVKDNKIILTVLKEE